MIRWRQQGYHDDLSFHTVSRRCKVDKCAWSSSGQYCFWFLIFSRWGTIIYDLGNTNNLVSMVTQTASFCFRRCFIPWSSFSSHKPHTKAKGRGENTKNRDRKKRKGKKFSEIQRHAKKLIEISVGGGRSTMQRLVHRVILLPTSLTSINRSVRLKRNWLYQTPLQKVLMKRASFKVEDTGFSLSGGKR